MYRVGVKCHFTAVHILEGDVPEDERLPHSHEYVLEWIFDVTELDSRGFSLDIALLERQAEKLCSFIGGIKLHELDYFADRNSSLENLCAYLRDCLADGLREELREADLGRIGSMEVRIWENEGAWAGISGEFPAPR